MKRKLVALVALALALAIQTDVLAHGLFLRHHLSKYSTMVVCRPYNAFTPVCYGSVTCDGCCPAPFCGGAAPMSTFPAFMGGPMCGPGCDAGMPPPPMMMPPPPMMMPPPMAMPLPPPMFPPHAMLPHGMPPHGMPPHGMPPHGMPPYAAAPMPQGPMPPHGPMPYGPMPYGPMPQGHPASQPIPPWQGQPGYTQTSALNVPQAVQPVSYSTYYPASGYMPAAPYPMNPSSVPSYWYGN